MPTNNQNFNQELEGFLRANGFDDLSTKDVDGNDVPSAKEADQFIFQYSKNGKDYGNVVITTHGGKVSVYYNQSLNRDSTGSDSGWTKFLIKLKDWALRNGQMEFKAGNIDNIGYEMKKRKQQKREEQLSEGYYGTRHTSYSDNTPKIKMIIKHSKSIDEGDQRYRYIDKIFLENELGERVLIPTKKPSVGRAFARHLAEGGQYNDERWKHIREIAEDINNLGGFVRATKTRQFNEGVMQVVSEAADHYQQLRETIKKIQSSRGYNTYFENWQPQLMEQNVENDFSSMFVSNRIDPRIEKALPVLNKLNIKVNEIQEATEFEQWATSIVEGQSPAMDHKIKEFAKLLSDSESLPVGADAMNVKGQLEDLIDDQDHKNALFDELDDIAYSDPDNDAIPTIISFLQKHKDEKFYGQVLDNVGEKTDIPSDEEIATEPETANQAPAPAPATTPAPPTTASPAAGAAPFMPQPLAEKAKKPVQRNFVAKHAQRSGAGSHGKKGFQRHDKHKKKLGEEVVTEGLNDNIDKQGKIISNRLYNKAYEYVADLKKWHNRDFDREFDQAVENVYYKLVSNFVNKNPEYKEWFYSDKKQGVAEGSESGKIYRVSADLISPDKAEGRLTKSFHIKAMSEEEAIAKMTTFLKKDGYQIEDIYCMGLADDQGVAESDEPIKIPTEDGITMQDIRLMAGEGKLSQKTIKQAIEVIRKQRKEQGVAEGSGPQVGDEVYYGSRLVGWFKGYSKYGKIITEPNVDEMGDEYLSKDAYWDPQEKLTIKPKQGVAEGFSDVVKGVKRFVKGKEHPDVVAAKHAGRAVGHYNQGDIAAGDKESQRYVKTRDMHLKAKGVAEGLLPGQAAWKKEMIAKGAVSFKRDQHGGGAVDRIIAYDKDGEVVGGFNRKGVAEMDNRTPSGDRREQRANSPVEKAKREKEFQDNLKKAGPDMRKKFRLPEPKEGVAEGSILKSIKRGLQGWDKNAVGPGGEKLGDPRAVVNRAKAMDIDTAKKVRAGLDNAPEHSPSGLQKRVLDRKLKGVAEVNLKEFAPSGGGDDILKTLAAQWLHGDTASGDLHSDIQSQEQVELRLEKGIICPDGVKRKLYIDYTPDYEGAMIYGDDDWSVEYRQDDLTESTIDDTLESIKRLSGLK